MGIFKKISFGLKKTRDTMAVAIDDALSDFDEVNDELFDAVEEILVMADVGVNTAGEIISRVRTLAKKRHYKTPAEVRNLIQEVIEEMLSSDDDTLKLETKPSIILVIGVNGAGKTTTIGKMAALFKSQGKKVIVGAADTFRAAAIEQLEVWTQRAEVDIVKHKEGADPAAVVFDTINAGKSRNDDIIICDTAGRLHNKKNLMDELAKIYKVIDRELPDADREILLVLDATTGQNAVNQAKEFGEVADITGIVLTKLDGTARGGVVLSIKNDLGIPVKFIGVGEQMDDLQPFNAKAFAMGLFGTVPEDYEEDEVPNSTIEETEETVEAEALTEAEEETTDKAETVDIADDTSDNEKLEAEDVSLNEDIENEETEELEESADEEETAQEEKTLSKRELKKLEKEEKKKEKQRLKEEKKAEKENKKNKKK
ncbi:MAG: signal recognition particle-docking protein FtsY [Clostridiales bacterium]|nr:signal recognition particle-docking protein FtsY [Clostridiales bacterium]